MFICMTSYKKKFSFQAQKQTTITEVEITFHLRMTGLDRSH